MRKVNAQTNTRTSTQYTYALLQRRWKQWTRDDHEDNAALRSTATGGQAPADFGTLGGRRECEYSMDELFVLRLTGSADAR